MRGPRSMVLPVISPTAYSHTCLREGLAISEVVREGFARTILKKLMLKATCLILRFKGNVGGRK